MDYSKLSQFRPTLDKFYNLKPSEDKKLIYACRILKNPLLSERGNKKVKRRNRQTKQRIKFNRIKCDN